MIKLNYGLIKFNFQNKIYYLKIQLVIKIYEKYENAKDNIFFHF